VERTKKQEANYQAHLLTVPCYKHSLKINGVTRKGSVKFACRNCDYVTAYRRTKIKKLLIERMYIRKYADARRRQFNLLKGEK
jgi:hypothetical protein